jgi:hypothetical protein
MAMQYIRRRIQRVSGVTIRDERIESRDFSVQPRWENWDDTRMERPDNAKSDREMRAPNRPGVSYRERT